MMCICKKSLSMSTQSSVKKCDCSFSYPNQNGLLKVITRQVLPKHSFNAHVLKIVEIKKQN